jgi:hypothetical protein
MSQANGKSDLDARIAELEQTLYELTARYLDGTDSVYSFYPEEINPPEPSDLERCFNDPEEGVRSFLSEALNGPAPYGRVLLSEDAGCPSFRLDKTYCSQAQN